MLSRLVRGNMQIVGWSRCLPWAFWGGGRKTLFRVKMAGLERGRGRECSFRNMALNFWCVASWLFSVGVELKEIRLAIVTM